MAEAAVDYCLTKSRESLISLLAFSVLTHFGLFQETGEYFSTFLVTAVVCCPSVLRASTSVQDTLPLSQECTACSKCHSLPSAELVRKLINRTRYSAVVTPSNESLLYAEYLQGSQPRRSVFTVLRTQNQRENSY